jgi:hypothetical protein
VSFKPTAVGRRRLNAALGGIGAARIRTMGVRTQKPQRVSLPFSSRCCEQSEQLHVGGVRLLALSNCNPSACCSSSSLGCSCSGFSCWQASLRQWQRFSRCLRIHSVQPCGAATRSSRVSGTLRTTFLLTVGFAVPPNYAFKPTAGELVRTNQPLRAGGGLTRR